MTSKEFAKQMFSQAESEEILSSRGLIKGNHGKRIHREQLISIYDKFGDDCVSISSKDLDSFGMGHCAHRTFRRLAAIVLKK